MIRKYKYTNKVLNAIQLGEVFNYMNDRVGVKCELENNAIYYQRKLTRYEIGRIEGYIEGMLLCGYGDKD